MDDKKVVFYTILWISLVLTVWFWSTIQFIFLLSMRLIFTFWELTCATKGKANTLSLCINYSAGSVRPNFKHEAQDFNPAKNNAFKIQAGELSDLEYVVDIMK